MQFLFLSIIITLFSRNNASTVLRHTTTKNTSFENVNPYSTIEAIPLPAGYTRVYADSSSFDNWLRKLPLKKNKTVYKFNGQPKSNQAAQFAVIDISVGHKDLQQCADAVIRLRAEYLYKQKKISSIDFIDNNHTHYRLPADASRKLFNEYLEKVFSYCGTVSLDEQLAPVSNFASVVAGDVLVKGGSPGHAMMIMDIAVNKQGKKIFLLSQSSMPAQDIHVVVNPINSQLSPWYEVNTEPVIETPERTFVQTNLKKWPY